MSIKKFVIISSTIVIVGIVIVTGLIYFNRTHLKFPSQSTIEKTQIGPKPEGNSESTFLYQETFYNCSQEIRGQWTEHWVGNPGGPGYYFVPDNKGDLDRYCRMDAVIEYRAVLDILKREDVHKTIEKYDTAQAWVRALGHQYIHDKDFLTRILPAYSTMKIDCIIVVHSPEGTRFFIENGEKHDSHEDHHYLEVPAAEFLASLNSAPESDVTNFWLGLH